MIDISGLSSTQSSGKKLELPSGQGLKQSKTEPELNSLRPVADLTKGPLLPPNTNPTYRFRCHGRGTKVKLKIRHLRYKIVYLMQSATA